MIDRTELARLAAALGGLPVLACRPNSPAERAGIKTGDIVLTVNGMKTPDWNAFIEARARDNEHMTVDLIREGVMVRLEIVLQHSAAPPLEPPSLLADIIGRDSVQLDTLIGLKKTGRETN
jgi:S1-C subfamily serine protease